MSVRWSVQIPRQGGLACRRAAPWRMSTTHLHCQRDALSATRGRPTRSRTPSPSPSPSQGVPRAGRRRVRKAPSSDLRSTVYGLRLRGSDSGLRSRQSLIAIEANRGEAAALHRRVYTPFDGHPRSLLLGTKVTEATKDRPDRRWLRTRAANKRAFLAQACTTRTERLFHPVNWLFCRSKTGCWSPSRTRGHDGAMSRA